MLGIFWTLLRTGWLWKSHCGGLAWTSQVWRKVRAFQFCKEKLKELGSICLGGGQRAQPPLCCPKPSLVFLHFFKLHVATTCNLTHTNLFLPAYGWHSPCHDNSAVQCCREQAILFKVERKRVCLYHMQLSSRQDALEWRRLKKVMWPGGDAFILH